MKINENLFVNYNNPEELKKFKLLKNITELLHKMEDEFSDNVAILKEDGNVTYKDLCLDVKSVIKVLNDNEILETFLKFFFLIVYGVCFHTSSVKCLMCETTLHFLESILCW